MRFALALSLVACAAPQRPTPQATPAVHDAPEPVAAATVEAEPQPPTFSAALTKGFADACGECHDSALETAKPDALAIFDLKDPEWLVNLDDARLDCTMGRMGGKDFVADAAKTELATIIADLRAS